MSLIVKVFTTLIALVLGIGSEAGALFADVQAAELNTLPTAYFEEVEARELAAEDENTVYEVIDSVLEITPVETVSEENAQLDAVETAAPVVIKSRQEIVAEEAAVRGTYGRIYIDEVGVDTAVFYSADLTNLQAIVDADDMAAMFDWEDGNTMIADHNYQGFNDIRYLTPGSYAELVTVNGTFGYTLQEIIYDAWNASSEITYNDGTPISVNYTSNLVIYTCNNDGTITVTIWA